MTEKKQLLNENFHKALKNYKEANYQIALTFFNETIKLDTTMHNNSSAKTLGYCKNRESTR
jgi:hypothetical protein